jgi:putative ABC transport system substrate-binding protein
MKRREFITLVSGAAVTWPLAARGQQPSQRASKRSLLGYLAGATQANAAPYIGIFLDGLREQGYAENREFEIVYRFADGQYDRLQPLARQLVELNPDVIITPTGEVAVLAIRAATQKIPIVSPTLGNPVQSGLIKSFKEPGGNVTGISMIVEHLPQKQLELATSALPGKVKFGMLVNAHGGETAFLQQREVAAASVPLKVNVVTADVRAPDDLDVAFRRLSEQQVEAVIVPNDGMFVTQRRRIVSLASTARVPDIHAVRDAVIDGGFLSYGIDLRENFRRAAALVVKILNGTQPAQLPVEFPTKLQVTLNLKTAKALGLTLSPTVLALADEVIE